MPSPRVVLLLAVLIGVSNAANAAAAERPAADSADQSNPFAAHNAYPWRLYGNDRFRRALAAGLKHVEVDVTYDAARQAIVVTHDVQPGGKEPRLDELLEPLWQQWNAAPGDGYTLIIDLKSARPEIAPLLSAMLEPQRQLLSTLLKRGGEFRPGKITVCLTGDGIGHRAYANSIPADGDYLAFSDDSVCPGSWQGDVAAYVPKQPPGFVRFLTYEKQNFMDSPDARGNEHVSPARLKELMRLADKAGYRVRIYTINPTRRANDQWDTRYWDACVAAGVHIATDAYETARDYWRRQPAAGTAP